MRGKRFTEEQIIAVLKEAEAGARTPDLCRRHGVSEQTFYRWKAQYGGLEISDLRRLRQLEDENSRLKRLVADLTLDNKALKELVRKKGLTPAAQREAIVLLPGAAGMNKPKGQVSQRKRKLVEEIFGWAKTIALLRKTRHRGVRRVGWMFTFGLAVYNLVRMRTLTWQPATG